MPIKLNSTGGGSVTLTTPSTASDFTVTIPAATGTMVTTTSASTIEFAAGTVSAPSITTTSDTNTGIYFPAADTIAFTEGGVESMRIDSSGNVGVGTSSPSAKLDVNGNTNITGTVVMSSSFLRNRIINGDMRIDQRNAGASVSISAYGYGVDRWGYQCSGGGVWSSQRTTVVPAGYVNSLGLTVTTPDASIGSADVYQLFQKVEGFNVADLGFGTANAQTITISFWVRSSITGTYSASLQNNAFNRGYVATFTVNAANTWEYKTLTVTGDTSGTWTTDNSIGIQFAIDLGSGSATNITAGSWQAVTTSALRTSGSVNWIATNGATFYITGVQLEVGTAATPFERRQYGQELMLCQRYYIKTDSNSALKRMFNNTGNITGICVSSDFPVAMRAAPTMTVYGDISDGAEITLGGAGLNIVQYSYSAYQAITNRQFLDLHYYIASAEL